MISTKRGFMRGALSAAVLAASLTAAHAQMDVKIMAPAAPGGGWDGTARSMQQALTAAGLSKNVQVTNVPGAGGAIGLAQFVNTAKGDASQLMVNGFVMVGSLITNKSPVNLGMVTPIARLTSEALVIVVPAQVYEGAPWGFEVLAEKVGASLLMLDPEPLAPIVLEYRMMEALLFATRLRARSRAKSAAAGARG